MYHGPGNGADVNGIFAKLGQGNTPWVLGYNEPDFDVGHGGVAASPQQAYDAWGNDLFRFSDRGARLVCPGVSSYDTDRSQFTGGPSGLTWLRQFASIGGNRPEQFRCDAQALHWYGDASLGSGADQARLFIDYVSRAHGTVNDIFHRDMDLWITEFAPEPKENPDVMADFLQVAMPWLDAQPYVARYSPFKAEFMLDGNRNLNAAGNVFIFGHR
ncbi:hypothetical protein B0T24DRAFT_612610 [Lasiosphaeria ovina]|nr:hypothetical protein B0T24DRAFT_612610 [Lasiosphaeria ovina]